MTPAACPNCGYSKTPPGKRSCYNCGRPLPVEGETPVAGPQVAPAASPPPWASPPTQPVQAEPAPPAGAAQPDVPAWSQPAQTPAAPAAQQVVSPAAPGWAAPTLAACPNCGYAKTPPGKRSCYNCGRPLPVEGETPVAGPQVAPAASPPQWASQPAQPVQAEPVPTAGACPNCGYSKTPPGKRSCYNCGRPLPVEGETLVAGPQVAPAASPVASPTPSASQPSPTAGACPNCGYAKTPPGKRSCYKCGRPLQVEGETLVAGPQVAPAASPVAQPVDPASQAAANTPTIAAAPPAPPPPAPPAWTPTHRVPAAGMTAWDKPDGSQPPIAQLQPYVELVVEANAGAWAQVRASNGWRGWVDGRLLTPVPAA